MQQSIRTDVQRLKSHLPEVLGTKLRTMRKSASVLQDAFVRLQMLMHEMQLLPLSYFGVNRCNSGQCNMFHGKDRHLDRQMMLKFFREHSHLAPAKATCLEWDAIHYSAALQANGTGEKLCSKTWVLQYKPADASRSPPPLLVDERKGLLLGDLTKLAPPELLGGMRESIDMVICNQVFEHVSQPFDAAKALFGLVKPGGYVLVTVPFLARYHGVPYDFFRYTIQGASAIFVAAGFEVVKTFKLGVGEHLGVGYLMGFGPDDVEPSYVADRMMRPAASSPATERTPIMSDETVWMVSALVARKPR